MQAASTSRVFARFDAAEHRPCPRLNRGCHRRVGRGVLAVVSSLGDGVFWYVLILMLPVLYGQRGLMPAAQMWAFTARPTRPPAHCSARSKRRGCPC